MKWMLGIVVVGWLASAETCLADRRGGRPENRPAAAKQANQPFDVALARILEQLGLGPALDGRAKDRRDARRPGERQERDHNHNASFLRTIFNLMLNQGTDEHRGGGRRR